jgi:hypothetical protein
MRLLALALLKELAIVQGIQLEKFDPLVWSKGSGSPPGEAKP